MSSERTLLYISRTNRTRPAAVALARNLALSVRAAARYFEVDDFATLAHLPTTPSHINEKSSFFHIWHPFLEHASSCPATPSHYERSLRLTRFLCWRETEIVQNTKSAIARGWKKLRRSLGIRRIVSESVGCSVA